MCAFRGRVVPCTCSTMKCSVPCVLGSTIYRVHVTRCAISPPLEWSFFPFSIAFPIKFLNCALVPSFLVLLCAQWGFLCLGACMPNSRQTRQRFLVCHKFVRRTIGLANFPGYVIVLAQTTALMVRLDCPTCVIHYGAWVVGCISSLLRGSGSGAPLVSLQLWLKCGKVLAKTRFLLVRTYTKAFILVLTSLAHFVLPALVGGTRQNLYLSPFCMSCPRVAVTGQCLSYWIQKALRAVISHPYLSMC